MTGALQVSYRYCRSVTRRRARNFYYSFVLLPRAEHDAICAIYAFMRYCDDRSDEPAATEAEARARIGRWRADLDAALGGRCAGHPVWPAFRDVVERYRIPHGYFHEMIEGVSSDLDPRRFRTFEELYRYCYQVASVAGLSVVHIFGFDSPEALPLAERCGVAFQLTNILRDIKEDAARDRIYLPAEDLERFGVSPTGVLAGDRSPALIRLLKFEADRARAYYAESRPLIGMVRRRNQSSLAALIEIYRRLLDRIEESGFDVFNERIRLSVWTKSWVVLRARFRQAG